MYWITGITSNNIRLEIILKYKNPTDYQPGFAHCSILVICECYKKLGISIHCRQMKTEADLHQANLLCKTVNLHQMGQI